MKMTHEEFEIKSASPGNLLFISSLRFILIYSLSFILVICAILILVFSDPLLAQELSLKAGIGSIDIEMEAPEFQSDSSLNQRHVTIALDMEKTGHPFHATLQGGFFTSGKETEDLRSPTNTSLQGDHMEATGIMLEALAYYIPYTYSPKGGAFSVRPYLGGGFIYRRFKLDREGMSGTMIPFTRQDTRIEYFVGSQRILAAGGMPVTGLFISAPKAGIDLRLTLGWGLMGVRSDTDYHVSFSGSEGETAVYSRSVDSSAQSIIGRLQIIKSWDAFSIGLGYEWERTRIDDKSLFFYNTGEHELWFPYPKYTIQQGVGSLFISYLF